jgi:hypothetical protein
MAMSNQPSWQEADAIAVLRLCNENLRPGHKVGVQQIMFNAINARLKHADVFDGVRSLVAKGDLILTDGETNVGITDQGFKNFW